MPLNRRQFAALGSAFAALGPSARAQAPSPPLRIGQIGLSFYQVAAAVVQLALEQRGVTSELQEGLHAAIYPRLARGEIDLLVAAWLPHAHGPLHEAARASTVELGLLYDDARLYWAVPDYVPASAVRGIDDLRRPEVAARMDKRIVGIGPDSGLMRGALQIHRDYGLAEAGYEVVTGPAADWVRNARALVAAGRWGVIPLWQPQWLNRALKLRILDEPRGIYRPDRCVLVASAGLQQRLEPAAWRLLQRLQLGLDAVTDMDHAVNVDGLSPREAARFWMTREAARVAAWSA